MTHTMNGIQNAIITHAGMHMDKKEPSYLLEIEIVMSIWSDASRFLIENDKRLATS